MQFGMSSKMFSFHSYLSKLSFNLTYSYPFGYSYGTPIDEKLHVLSAWRSRQWSIVVEVVSSDMIRCDKIRIW